MSELSCIIREITINTSDNTGDLAKYVSLKKAGPFQIIISVTKFNYFALK